MLESAESARSAARPAVIRLIDGRPQLVLDHWRLIDSAADWDRWDHWVDAGSVEGALLPLALALMQPERVRAATHVSRASGPGLLGLWLGAADDPALALPLLSHVALVSVHFPKFTDGRGYSTAVLMRTRLGWRGELRAVGEILQDQLYALRRVGFDSFALRADRDPQAALAAFTPFTDSYQGSVDQALPAFRRAATAL